MQGCVLYIFNYQTLFKSAKTATQHGGNYNSKMHVSCMLHYLKKDSVPSQFPNAPSHISKPKKIATKISWNHSFQQTRKGHERYGNFKRLVPRANDDISNLPLDGIERRLVDEATWPTGFRTAVIDKSLLIYTLVTNDLVPSISASVTVSSQLLVTLCYNGNVLPESKYSDIVFMARCRLCRNYSILWLESSVCRRTRYDVTGYFTADGSYESADSKGQGRWWLSILNTMSLYYLN